MTKPQTTKLTDEQEWVLEMLKEHGPCQLSVGADLTACEFLQPNGYISETQRGLKKLTSKGARYLREHT